MERSNEFAEDLHSKFPDFHIQADRDGRLQELRGVFEEKAFTLIRYSQYHGFFHGGGSCHASIGKNGSS